jgi:hypothetical protein
MKQVEIGEIEIPLEYFNLSVDEKETLCLEIMNAMIEVLDKTLKPNFDRKEVLDLILQSSIMTNIKTEQYEICQFLSDVRKLLNEQTS